MGITRLKKSPSIISGASVVGKKESEGPLRDEFDLHDLTDRFSMNSWEKSEGEMQRLALNIALSKCKLRENDIDALFAGDLINQCTSSAYGLVDFNIPFFGIYGACSTFAEGMILGAANVSSGIFRRCAIVTSSHFCSAERQFRFPLEYGGQRPPTSQRTVTGAGAVIISDSGKGPYITDVLAGVVVDKGITDANNMGAAMAPAAIDTISKYFKESNTDPSDYDLVLTGDLGMEGHGILSDYMKSMGYDMSINYNDCGLMIYNSKEQDVHSGASGCGCSATVFSSLILNKMRKRELNNILFIATGALMSPDSLKQGHSIPGIAHLVHISSNEG